MVNKVISSVPGKLYIAGEYAVVANKPAIIAPVDQFIYVTIEAHESPFYQITSTLFPHLVLQAKTIADITKTNEFKLVGQALAIAQAYLQQNFKDEVYFTLHITSDLIDKEQKKYGLGSSGAVVCAVIKAISQFFSVQLTSLDVFKLSTLTLANAGHNGSFGDVACSSYEHLIYYRKPDTDWLTSLQKTHTVPEIVMLTWPHLKIEPLPWPPALKSMIAWTGAPADSGDLVEAVNDFFQQNPLEYSEFLEQSENLVETLRKAFLGQNIKVLLDTYGKLAILISKLSKATGDLIEIEPLEKLREIANKYGTEAKPSGAGGGDCGVVLTRVSKKQQLKSVLKGIKKELKEQSITLLPFNFITKEKANSDTPKTPPTTQK